MIPALPACADVCKSSGLLTTSRKPSASRRFSFRQRQVLWGKLAGLADKEIAFQLGITSPTVSAIVMMLLRKMGYRAVGSHAARRTFLAYLHALAERPVPGKAR